MQIQSGNFVRFVFFVVMESLLVSNLGLPDKRIREIFSAFGQTVAL